MAFVLVTHPLPERTPEKNQPPFYSGSYLSEVSANVWLVHCGSTVCTWQEHVTEETAHFMTARKQKRGKEEAKISKFPPRAYLQII